MLEFKSADTKYEEEAVRLAAAEYRKEYKSCEGALPELEEVTLEMTVKEAFGAAYTRIALLDGKLIGYLCFAGPWEGMFGNVKGVFSPLGWSAFGGEKREKLASMLFADLAKELAAKQVCSFSLSRYAHDAEVGRSFVMNGFGIRCSDAIMEVSQPKRTVQEAALGEKKGETDTVTAGKEKLQIRELAGADKRIILPLRKGLILHMAKAPVFFPTALEQLDCCYEDARVFAAFCGEEPVGYMTLGEEAENFVTLRPDLYNICGAYVKPQFRRTGAAQQLLEHLRGVCAQEGRRYLGVDCETLNPTALRFWGKYFWNYTYSYSRRIDERIQGYMTAME